MEKKQDLLANSKNSIQIFDERQVKASIMLSFERTGVKFNESTARLIYDGVMDLFPQVPTEMITAAIKKGSYGEFGETYRLSAQEVCKWIRSYLDLMRKKTLLTPDQQYNEDIIRWAQDFTGCRESAIKWCKENNKLL